MATKIDILRNIIVLQSTKTKNPDVIKSLINDWKNEIKNKRYDKINKNNVRGIAYCQTYQIWKPQLYVNRKATYSGTFRTLDSAYNSFVKHLEQKIL